MDEVSEQLQVFRSEKTKSMQNVVQLWPAKLDPAVEEELRKAKELRESQEKERLAKEEEERKAAEAAAKGKKGAPKQAAAAVEQPADGSGEVKDDGAVEIQEPFKSQDDDPEKTFEFLEFKKIMSEIPAGQTTVGTMLGAMVYQIGQESEKRLNDAMDDKYFGKGPNLKKITSMSLRKRSSLIQKQADELDEEMGSLFEKAFQGLRLEHAIVETDYRHEFQE